MNRSHRPHHSRRSVAVARSAAYRCAYRDVMSMDLLAYVEEPGLLLEEDAWDDLILASDGEDACARAWRARPGTAAWRRARAAYRAGARAAVITRLAAALALG